MNMRKKTIALSMLAPLVASFQSIASSDGFGCVWGTTGCYLTSSPVLDITNDTRDNLLRLVGERKHLALPLQPLPADMTRSREFYFGPHEESFTAAPPTADSTPTTASLNTLLAGMGLNYTPPATSEFGEDEAENRHVSNSAETLSGFVTVLLADNSLSSEQKRALAQARIGLSERPENRQVVESLNFPSDSNAGAFADYLLAISDFYQGHYPAAKRTFTRLQSSQQPWVAETAGYMLMRTALNQSSQHASGEYGEFDVKKIDKNAAAEALSANRAYLAEKPEGLYALSAQGMLRRIYWYLGDWDPLAQLYEQALNQAVDSDGLIALVAENDAKLQSKDRSGDNYFISASEAPLLTFTQALRLMRINPCKQNVPCVDRPFLDGLEPIFSRSGHQPLWQYLNLMQAFRTGDYAAVIEKIKPATALPSQDILLFSEQVLYGDALMAQHQQEAARQHWSRLLRLSQDAEQQQFLQARLAAVLVQDNQTAQIFMPDSQVTSLRYRSLVLKTRAAPALLRQQAKAGPNDEERTIALHTLLITDLTEGRYADWLQDKNLIRAIAHPVEAEAFDDVQLSHFNWSGEQAATGYSCPRLEEVVTRLSQRSGDGHALNCLGEFFRTTAVTVSLWKESGGNGALDGVVKDDRPRGQPDRQHYYRQVILDNHAEPEDKSYALYRAVMCYGPSGYNGCGGDEVSKTQRKRWFSQLKSDYPGSLWAKKLKYYW
ncbi:Conserved hypothetical protein [Erwinia tasmaniensis Et1/99]|uniref:Outer membrane assembly lipoprotein YfiO n=2 Tax=Erwinia tasmaniensis TaxID=338565 RepID=B2VDT5_ERWT9|nr:Conserved hypothetical protein [Erwinia tasmaniensis Et1/99]